MPSIIILSTVSMELKYLFIYKIYVETQLM